MAVKYKYLICENCKQVVARFDPDKVSIPVTGGMFQSHFHERGVHPPWQPGVEAQWMICPQCPKRVFNEPIPLHLTVSDTIDGLDPYFFDLEVAPAEGDSTDGGDQHTNAEGRE